MKIYNQVKLVATAILGLGAAVSTYGQQDPQYTHYMYNTNMINPAYAASKDNLSIFGMYRAQWVGLDGAPKTATVSATTPIGDRGLAMGINFTNDRLGIMDENTISIDLAYSIDLNYEYKLAFGLKGSANLLSVDYTKAIIHNPNDPISQTNISNKFTPNVGAGVYLYSDRSYLGISVPNFIEADRYDDNDMGGDKIMRQKMHFYLMGGYVFDLNESLKFKPAFLLKAVQGAPLQADITANFLIKEKLTLGAAYRWDAALSALVGFQVTEGLFVGYSYDAETTKLRNYNSGSHEVFLKFDLFNRKRRVNTPRFF